MASSKAINKKKIFNDPVYGFITIPHEIVFHLIEHPLFQRLRRIRQLGWSELIYPGATHTRFHHALGAMHLMMMALDSLKSKGVLITKDEHQAACIAILLHDIGHGPYSHALEGHIIPYHHEEISLYYMQKLNLEFDSSLDLAISIFTDQYPRKFFHQLVSSQLDMDRLDYLTRDSFYTGVYEGVISYDRIIKMLDVKQDQLVIEEKGIYSIEKFLISRRLMYWQVYLHKTVLCAEELLILYISRIKQKRTETNTSPLLYSLLYNNTNKLYNQKASILDTYSLIDDFDILQNIKENIHSKDSVLSTLAQSLFYRKLYKLYFFKKKPNKSLLNKIAVLQKEMNYYLHISRTSNRTYNPSDQKINILRKDGRIIDLAQAAEELNIHVQSQPIVKHFIIYHPVICKKILPLIQNQ